MVATCLKCGTSYSNERQLPGCPHESIGNSGELAPIADVIRAIQRLYAVVFRLRARDVHVEIAVGEEDIPPNAGRIRFESTVRAPSGDYHKAAGASVDEAVRALLVRGLEEWRALRESDVEPYTAALRVSGEVDVNLPDAMTFAQAARHQARPALATCGQCDKPVDSVDSWCDIMNRVIIVVFSCHGETEQHAVSYNRVLKRLPQLGSAESEEFKAGVVDVLGSLIGQPFSGKIADVHWHAGGLRSWIGIGDQARGAVSP